MIVLDTHVLLWLASEPERLSSSARQVIESEEQRAICTISAQEIAYLVARRRISLDRRVRDWIAAVLVAHEIIPIEPTLRIALRAGGLDPGRFPGDPADRLIYATAFSNGGKLVSADARLNQFDPGAVIW